MAYRAGMVAMLGKPNVGKSTLLNALVGHKVSVVSNKPQTTRRRVLGIVQGEDYQVAMIDTPGIHEPHTVLGRAMVESARQALSDIDAILYVADISKKPDDTDKQIARLISPDKVPFAPIILCLNKMDLLAAEMVTENVEAYCKLFGTENYMLTTATRGHNLDKVLELLLEKMPEGEPMFPTDEYTDQSLRFMAAEIIREKVLVATRQEVPHATAVVVEQWEEEETGLVRIEATIVVEKQGQKGILIGKQGSFLKTVGTAARLELQILLEKPVYLQLYVKVREDWRMNPRMLHELEYTE
jgi:GTP-binding protein Era